MFLSIILPTRNEKDSIGKCITDIKKVFKNNKIKGEIIVSDSSNDGSDQIAKKLGAKVIKHDKKGFGIAVKEGIKVAKGDILIFSDADSTYEIADIPKFIKSLEKADFVIGSRLKGKMEKGSMRILHRYIGNPGLTFLSNLFFNTKLTDIHCALRAIRRKDMKNIEIESNGFGYYTEMLIKISKKNFKIIEIPTNYYKRRGKPHLKTIPDGWTNLKLMLAYALKSKK